MTSEEKSAQIKVTSHTDTWVIGRGKKKKKMCPEPLRGSVSKVFQEI